MGARASRTASGGALLANDPHLEAIQPGIWLEMHLTAPGYRARGVALPWTPGIVLGTTAHHAWGATNVSGDVQDLFLEELADDGLSVRRGEDWSRCSSTPRRSRCGRGPLELTVLETSHGPLLDRFPVGEGEVEHVPLDGIGAPGAAVALAWTGLEHAIQPSLAIRRRPPRRSTSSGRAVRGVSCPGQNFVYADVDGMIGYTCTGVYPVRRTGDGTVPVTAADGEHAWMGTIEPDELPWGVDPARGYLVSANNRPHDDEYPHLIGRDFHPPHRAERIVQELDGHDQRRGLGGGPAGRHRLAPRPSDRGVSPRRRGRGATDRRPTPGTGPRAGLGRRRPRRFRARCHLPGVVGTRRAEGRRRRADDELFEQYHADREVWHCRVLPEVAGRVLEGDAGTTGLVLDAFDDAVAELRTRLGEDPSAWRWGPSTACGSRTRWPGSPGWSLCSRRSTPRSVATNRRSRRPRSTAGPGTWSCSRRGEPSRPGGPRRSVGVLPAGTSGNPASPHWNDQAPLWLAGRTHPLPFTPAAVEAAAVSLVRLTPATISS